MEDAVAGEVTPSNPTEGAQHQSKENGYALGLENSNIFDCQEMRRRGDDDNSLRIPVESNYPESSTQEFFKRPYGSLGLCPPASGSGSGSWGSSRVNTAFRDNVQMSNDLENVGYPSLEDIMAQRANTDSPYDTMEELTNTEDRGVSGNPYAGIRTKILSKSRSINLGNEWRH